MPQTAADPLTAGRGRAAGRLRARLQGGRARRVALSADASRHPVGRSTRHGGRRRRGHRGTAPIALTVLPDGAAGRRPRAGRARQRRRRAGRAAPRPPDRRAAAAGRADRRRWHTFLSLLARTAPRTSAPRAASPGPGMAAGGGPIEIREIDYAEVLRERAGGASTADWDSIVANCLEGDAVGPRRRSDGGAARDRRRSRAASASSLERLQDAPGRRTVGRRAGTRRWSALLQALADYALSTHPSDLDEVLNQRRRRARRA